ncbi:hypothetical protein ACS126_09880 [Sphingobacterium lactis]|uniref:hypothetical protein n=1 Tax=Sphingobacterium lactis TaxID=797291 RepID=UPI003EC7B8FF
MENNQLKKEVQDLKDFQRGCIEAFHKVNDKLEQRAKENQDKGYHDFLGVGLSAYEISDMMSKEFKGNK